MFQFNGKKYILNPTTNRHILVGGKQYKKLVKEGVIKDQKMEITPIAEDKNKTKPRYEIIDLEEK